MAATDLHLRGGAVSSSAAIAALVASLFCRAVASLFLRTVGPYWAITKRAGLYSNDGLAALPTRPLKQMWRNQLLAEVALKTEAKSEEVLYVLLHPGSNDYQVSVSADYTKLLTEKGRGRYSGITYEHFIKTAEGVVPTIADEPFAKYLRERYLFKK